MHKPPLNMLKQQLFYRLGLLEHLMMFGEYIQVLELSAVNTFSDRSVGETNTDLLDIVESELHGICKTMMDLYTKEELGDLYPLLVDRLTDISNNPSSNTTTIHQTDGKVH